MKAVYLALALILGLSAPAVADIRSDIASALKMDYASNVAEAIHKNVRVDLGFVVNKDFTDRPTVDQAVAALQTDMPFAGFGWQVVVGHVGLGGNYFADFIEQSDRAWWLDWNAHAIYASFHLFEPRAFLDPYVSAGAGCSGQIYLGPSGDAGEGLAISIYPFVAAGAAVNVEHLRVGAELAYAPWSSAIPVTPIPEFPLGDFQVSIFVGFGI